MPEMLDESRTRAGDRQFPWRCPRCLQKTVRTEVIQYRAKASHDGRIYELDIEHLEVPRCSACGELVFSNRVDDQIVRALRARLRLLTPEQMQDARHKLGLSPRDLAERLGVAEEDVCRWEAGLQVQSRAMDNLLRVFITLPDVRALLSGAKQDPGPGLKVSV